MKEWWGNLAFREKQALSVGVVVIIIFLIYGFIWAPLNNKVKTIRTHIERNQALLAWMTAADIQIQRIQKNNQKPLAAVSAGSLLSVIQNQINLSPIATNLSELRQFENDSVQLRFKQVEFDKMIAWLAELCQENKVVITQLTITSGESPGIVAAEFVLKTSH